MKPRQNEKLDHIEDDFDYDNDLKKSQPNIDNRLEIRKKSTFARLDLNSTKVEFRSSCSTSTERKNNTIRKVLE